MVATKDLGKYRKAIVLRQLAQRKTNEWRKHFFAMREQRDKLKQELDELKKQLETQKN